MSFPKFRTGNRVCIKYGNRWAFRFLLLVFITFILLSINPSEADSMDAEVEARLDQHYVVHTIGPNSTDTIYISGNISCKFDGWGSSVQTIEILIFASNELDWYTSAGPDPITFHENGIKSMFVTIPIPINTYNNTVNTITVWGTWHTEPHEKEPLGANGDIKTDTLSITIYREWYVGAPVTITPEYDTHDTWWEEIGPRNRLIVISIPMLTVVIVVVALLYRRKKKIEKRLEEEILLYGKLK